jgi:hypothetical protein
MVFIHFDVSSLIQLQLEYIAFKKGGMYISSSQSLSRSKLPNYFVITDTNLTVTMGIKEEGGEQYK